MSEWLKSETLDANALILMICALQQNLLKTTNDGIADALVGGFCFVVFCWGVLLSKIDRRVEAKLHHKNIQQLSSITYVM